MFLGVGALTWSLWSGMEVAPSSSATWALRAGRAGSASKKTRAWAHVARAATAWWLGLAGALLVATRPEAALTIGIFGLAAALAHRRHGLLHVAGLLFRVGILPVVVLALQSVANRVLTGESSANGAIVKLALNNPFMTAEDKLADWVFNVKYAALRQPRLPLRAHRGRSHERGRRSMAGRAARARVPGEDGVVGRHRSARPGGAPLCFARTRRIAIVLWAQIVGWIVLVAFNGQVRWQNERYVMPAVAWMLILAALGVTVALRRRAAPIGWPAIARFDRRSSARS